MKPTANLRTPFKNNREAACYLVNKAKREAGNQSAKGATMREALARAAADAAIILNR